MRIHAGELGSVSRPMAYIDRADYETVEVVCDACSRKVVLNRLSDVGYVGPYANDEVRCPDCKMTFTICGDTVNTAYEMFIFDADRHFADKRYMLTVTVLAQAWEIFLSTFADSIFLWRPFFTLKPPRRDVSELNDAQAQLHAVLRDFSFFDLQSMVTRLAVASVQPSTLAEARTFIPQLKNYHRTPPRRSILDLADSSSRALLLDLREVSVGTLRNDAVHQRAKRVTRDEAVKCREEEVALLYRLKRHFRVGTFEEFAAGVVDRKVG